ncbi:hypothetical protein [Catellatospora vulcania]|uniref:hypothetical protein n=1 Tax=Catellatospora vulcania TaxID=1460450 RepID=UPI0012D43083|nr:hypothetical protein [Catellatospora vulcania]
MGGTGRRRTALVLALVLAGGCTLGEIFANYSDPVEPRPADIVGTWRDGDREIVFGEDGAFTATRLPYGALHEAHRGGFAPDERIDGAGTWQIAAPATAPDGPQTVVRLTFRQLGEQDVETYLELSALDQDGVTCLVVIYAGAVGNSWTAYARCERDC